MIRFLQKYLDGYWTRAYNAGYQDGLDEADKRRAAALEKVWQVIDEPTIPGTPYTHSAVGPLDHFDAAGAAYPAGSRNSDPCCTPAASTPSNVVSLHLRRADGKWHL